MEEERRKMQESILGLFNKKMKNAAEQSQEEKVEAQEEKEEKENEVSPPDCPVGNEIKNVTIEAKVERELRAEMEETKAEPQDENCLIRKIIEIPICNFGPGCKCNPDLSEITNQSKETDKGKEKRKKRIKKVAKKHGPFEYNLKVDFHDANSNFYQLLSSEDEEDQYSYVEEEDESDSSSNIDYKESEEDENEMKNAAVGNTEYEGSESNSFISTFSEDEVEIVEESENVCDNGPVAEEPPERDTAEVEAEGRDWEVVEDCADGSGEKLGMISPDQSEHFEEVKMDNLINDGVDEESKFDLDPDDNVSDFNDVYHVKEEEEQLEMAFTKVDLPHDTDEADLTELTISEDKTENVDEENITADTAGNICQLDEDIALIAEEQITQITDNCRDQRSELPSQYEQLQEAQCKKEGNTSNVLQLENKEKDAEQREGRTKSDDLTLDSNYKFAKRESDSFKHSHTRLDSKYTKKNKPKSCDKKVNKDLNMKSKYIARKEKKINGNNCVQNCRDIFNLLQLEEARDLELKADWERRSPGSLSLSEAELSLGTPSKSSPLPPISKLKEKRPEAEAEPRGPPSWSRVENSPLNILEDLHNDVTQADSADKWLRSSTPANTLPKLQRKLNLG